MEQLFNICGWIGSLGLILGYLPQAIQTIRTRTTDGISLPGFIMMAVGAFAFVVQGLISANYYLALTNFITFTCSVIIFAIKMHNDYFRKH
jgi:MtN3 and saliva related transmembrane protein